MLERDFSTKTYGFLHQIQLETVCFRSNAPASPNRKSVIPFWNYYRHLFSLVQLFVGLCKKPQVAKLSTILLGGLS
jgi:hypothetical protein